MTPPCDRRGCHCGLCGLRRDRIAAVDDRGRVALESLARDLDAERYGTARELEAERHGRRR